MSSTWFCMVGPWHSVTGVQIFRRKWKLLHWSWGSDVIPLYRPTAREINLMTNSQICRFYVFSFAKCKIDGMASKELFPSNIQYLSIRYILPSICLIHEKEGNQRLCIAHDWWILCRLFRGLRLAGSDLQKEHLSFNLISSYWNHFAINNQFSIMSWSLMPHSCPQLPNGFYFLVVYLY